MQSSNPFIYQQNLSSIEIVLCRVSHSGNIGSIARAMKVMGLNKLILVNPICLPDDLSYAMAAHATDILDNITILNRLQDALIDSHHSIAFSARNRLFTRKTATVREIFVDLRSDIVFEKKISLVFGNEQHGLNSDELEACEMLGVIPTNHPQYSSLNLSQAVQIACYEVNSMFSDSVINMTNDHDKIKDKDIVNWADVLYLLERIETILEKSSFYKHDKAHTLKNNLKNVLYKANLNRDELNLLHGIFKHLGS
jgi:tRNA (cytidine32/uridine32-2'-O)-methyltransferase